MNSIQTRSFDLPRRKAHLLADLFKGDGGAEYENAEIEQANLFIAENRLKNLLEVEETPQGEVRCTFITDNKQPDDMEFIYVLLSEELKQNYTDYGLLPYKPENRGHDHYLFLPADMKRNCEKTHPSGVVVDNLGHKLSVWW